jgi:hypothetical protein
LSEAPESEKSADPLTPTANPQPRITVTHPIDMMESPARKCLEGIEIELPHHGAPTSTAPIPHRRRPAKKAQPVEGGVVTR